MIYIIVEDRRDPDYGLRLCTLDRSSGLVLNTARFCGPDIGVAWQIAMRENYRLGYSREEVIRILADWMGEQLNTVPV